MFAEEFNSSMKLCCVETNHHKNKFIYIYIYSLASVESRRVILCILAGWIKYLLWLQTIWDFGAAMLPCFKGVFCEVCEQKTEQIYIK